MANVYSNTDTAQFLFIYHVTRGKQNHVTLETNCVLTEFDFICLSGRATLTHNITVTDFDWIHSYPNRISRHCVDDSHTECYRVKCFSENTHTLLPACLMHF